jgi:hypothetical protein
LWMRADDPAPSPEPYIESVNIMSNPVNNRSGRQKLGGRRRMGGKEQKWNKRIPDNIRSKALTCKVVDIRTIGRYI